MNDPTPSQQAPSVADLVARFNNPTTTTTQPSQTSPWRLPSGRVRQLAGAYEAQLRALLKQLEEERARRRRAHNTHQNDREDAVLEAALRDVQRLLAAHCHATPHTLNTALDASEGPGTPDPLDEPSRQAGHDTVPTDDGSLRAAEQRVHDLLQRMEANAPQGLARWLSGPLELQPTAFDPLTANSMYADPLRQAAFPLALQHSDED